MRNKILVVFLGVLFSLISIEIFLRLSALELASTPEPGQRKSGRAYTIMTLGNSHTYGTGAPAGLSYPDQLSHMLNTTRGAGYHVVNKGLRNINTTFIKENVNHWLSEVQPNLVFIMTGEANYWNRYGYWSYLQSRSDAKASFFERLDFLRVFSTYKFIELLLNREETWFNHTDYSNTFRGYKKSGRHEDKIFLGYAWIGSLEEGGNFDFFSLRPEQAQEALKMLEYVWEKDKNPSAARLIAEYHSIKRDSFDLAMDYLNKTIEASDTYCFPCSRLINKLYTRTSLSNQNVLTSIKKKLDTKKGKVSYENLIEFLFDVENPKTPLNERMRIAESMSYAYPGSVRILNIIYHNGAKTHPLLFIEALKRTLKVNPLAATGNIPEKIHEIKVLNSAFAKQAEEILTSMENRFPGIDFRNVTTVNKIVGEWAIADLDAIVSSVVQSGARAIVQNYPRVRSGPKREIDDLIRKWWMNKKDKANIDFIDVNLLLDDRLQKNGDYYYATHLGPYDNHLNEHGYEELAKIMVPYVPVIK